MSLSIRILPEPLRTVEAATISAASGAYVGIGTALVYPSRVFYLLNTTDVLLTFSWDGVNDHQVLPSNAFLLLDITSNSMLPTGSFSIAQGTRFYVKGDPSTGDVYLSSYYASTF